LNESRGQTIDERKGRYRITSLEEMNPSASSSNLYSGHNRVPLTSADEQRVLRGETPEDCYPILKR